MKSGGLPYTKYVNRRLGKLIAQNSADWMTPNGLTITSFLLFLCALVTLSYFDTVWGSVLAVGLFLAQYALDSADGMLARRRGVSSLIGEWLDHSLDGVRIIILNICILFNFYFDVDGLQLIELFGFAITITALSSNYISNALKSKILQVRSGEVLDAMNSRRRALMKAILTPADFGIYFFIFLFWTSEYFSTIYLAWGAYFFAIFLMNYSGTFLRKL